MDTLMVWIFWLYFVPAIALTLIIIWEGENPFTKENVKVVFVPIVNIYHFLIEYTVAILYLLISWGEFIGDIGKSFKKRFL